MSAELLRHASRLAEYRTPFGAQPADAKVKITFEAFKDSTDVTLCYSYGLYDFSYNEEPMKISPKVSLLENDEELNSYSAELTLPHEPGLLFYWFRVSCEPDLAAEILPEYRDRIKLNTSELEAYVYYVAEAGTRFGSGKPYYEPPRIGVDEDKYPYAWQITVYKPGFVTPDSMKGSIIYQIFPDRFARDTNYSFEKMCSASPRDERIYHENWYEEVDIAGKPDTGYLACDFFGGSLTGILEKLDYIQSLGINIIYLNPIFEARSSHRYDTADYMKVDPILGGNEAFEKLSSEAQARGISIIIDGVYSHTGADSKYFNKFDRYDGIGAFRSFKTGEESPYRSWYSFIDTDDDQILYKSWWGFPDLPNVDENNLSYREFIFGENGVIHTWIERGAGGVRLDVSDELPDSFIRQMRDTVKKYSNNQACLVGEVWEDASNKCSYGSYRDFLLGRTHDSVMGYTFRDGILGFLNGSMDAQSLDSYLEGFRERYPAEAYYCIMNLISSHDVPRAVTVLAGDMDPCDREKQLKLKLSSSQEERGSLLMKLACAIQIGYIGAPCIYYGDEVLMQGYKDPFNRRPYPWGQLDQRQKEHLEFVRKIGALRTDNDVLRTGFYRTLVAQSEIFAFERYLDVNGKDFFGKRIEKGCKRIVLLLNRSEEQTCRFSETKEGYEAKMVEEDGIMRPEGAYAIPRGDKTWDFSVDLRPLSFMFILY